MYIIKLYQQLQQHNEYHHKSSFSQANMLIMGSHPLFPVLRRVMAVGMDELLYLLVFRGESQPGVRG